MKAYLAALMLFAGVGASLSVTAMGLMWLFRHGDLYVLGIGAALGVLIGAIAIAVANWMYSSMSRTYEALLEPGDQTPDDMG